MYSNKKIIYIGRSKNIKQRMNAHKHGIKEGDWFNNEVDLIKYGKCKSNAEACILEIYLIDKHRPKYNKEYSFKDKLDMDLSCYLPNFKETGVEDTHQVNKYSLKYLKDNMNFKNIKLFESPNHTYKNNNVMINGVNRYLESDAESLQKSIYTFFRNGAKTKSNESIWVSTNSAKGVLKGKGYTKGWADIDSKNTKINTKAIAFVLDAKLESTKDRLFLDMLNFIYRHDKGNDILLYIPSSNILKKYKKFIEEMNR